jgi:hypothetical protein
VKVKFHSFLLSDLDGGEEKEEPESRRKLYKEEFNKLSYSSTDIIKDVGEVRKVCKIYS